MNYSDLYLSREEAGKVLAGELKKLNLGKPILLAIPRGGIQVAEAIADEFQIPIYSYISKKMPIPGNPETAFGAITEDGTRIIDENIVGMLNITEQEIDVIASRINRNIKHRVETYGHIDTKKMAASDVILVDDGVATGHSILAAIKSIKQINPKSLTVAVPVSTSNAYEEIKKLVDNVVCPLVEKVYFFGVSSYYKEWYDLTEEQIKAVLGRYRIKYQN